MDQRDKGGQSKRLRFLLRDASSVPSDLSEVVAEQLRRGSLIVLSGRVHVDRNGVDVDLPPSSMLLLGSERTTRTSRRLRESNARVRASIDQGSTYVTRS